MFQTFWFIFVLSFTPQQKRIMTTMTITAPIKPGKLAYFTIEFPISAFDEVCDLVATMKTPQEIMACKAWTVKN